MLRFQNVGLLAAAALVAACGSRSSLTDGAILAASGGAGGSVSTSSSSSSSTSASSSSSSSTSASSSSSTSASSSASSSSGTGGGPPVICQGLFLSGAPITHDAMPDHVWHPVFVPATEDAARVSMAFWHRAPEGPAIPPLRMGDVTFEPWGPWPSGLGPPYEVLEFFADSFAVAPALPSSQPGFSTLFYVPTGSFPSDMALANAAPQTDYSPFPPPIAQWDAFEPGWAVALARGTKGHLALYQGDGPYAYLSVARVSPGELVNIYGVACADAPFPADTVPAQGGFLVASASGGDFNACLLDDGIPGPARRLLVSRFDLDADHLVPAASFEEPDPIAHVAMAKANDGAWVVWQNDGSSALQPPPIRAVRLDESGAQIGPVFNVTHDGQTSGPFAVASLGVWLAVAWVDAIDPSFPTLRVDLFGPQGTFLSGTSLNTSPNWLHDPALALMASPNGQHLLLAWSDIDVGSSTPASTRVARFSCGALP